MRAKIRTAVWDFNGTIADDLWLSYSSACDILRHYGAKCYPTLDQFRRGISADWTRFYRAWGVPETATPAALNALRIAHFRETTHLHAVKPHGDADTVLSLFGEAGVTNALFSGECRDLLELRLAQFGMRGHFAIVRPDTYDKAAAILALAADGALDPALTLYVDDDPRALIAAKRAGCTTVGMTHGYATGDLIEEARPHCVAHDFTDFMVWVSRFTDIPIV